MFEHCIGNMSCPEEATRDPYRSETPTNTDTGIICQ